MAKFTSTGNGLNILLACDCLPHHEWMAFASWYSISKNLPDAQVTLLCHRHQMNYQLFSWPKKCGLKFGFHRATDKRGQIEFGLGQQLLSLPLLVLDPEIMVLREFEPDLLEFLESRMKAISDKVWWVQDMEASEKDFPEAYVDAKSEKITSFVSIENGWGNFVTSKWINRIDAPFVGASRYGTHLMTSNEVKIQRLWEQMNPLLQIVSRG
jgi:hypothetical protein